MAEEVAASSSNLTRNASDDPRNLQKMRHPKLGDMPMDASIWTESKHANASSELTEKFLVRDSRPITNNTEVSVVILYADPVIAAGLTAVLHEHAGFKIVPTGEPGRNIGCVPPAADVIVADYESALRLAESAPQWARNLVVFTSCDSEAKICRALETGARGYLLHGAGLPELFDGIRSVRGGGVALSPLVATRITNRLQRETLTAREKAVLGQLMLGLSNKAIASRLNLCVGTVKAHLKSILRKLDADSRTAAVIAAQRRGVLA